MATRRIDAIEVFNLKKDGWTLQQLADRYSVTKIAVYNYLTRKRTRVNQNTPLSLCRCGCLKPVTARKRFYASRACYFGHVAIPGNYTSWRHGQRIARRVVLASGFKLEPQHIVHHVDRDNCNNVKKNLWVFESHSRHMSFHRGGLGRPIWRGDGEPI